MPNGLEPKPVPEPIGKSWWSSKTNKFGVLLAVLGLAILSLPEFAALVEQLPAEYQGIATLVISTVVMALRWVTSEPIASKGFGK